ncbi:MAG: outer membrane beta-barrel protein [Saprospiraceae bacterium]|nr:outer membrane beta-barrel protein [Saprospiraceae bacterium]
MRLKNKIRLVLPVIMMLSCQFGKTQVEGLDQQKTIKDTVASPFIIAGNADFYYRISDLKQSSLTSMILKHGQIAMGSINLELSYNTKKIGGMLNLAAGPRADQFYALDGKKVLKYIKQAYVYYVPVQKLTFYLGTSTAIIGYEFDEACKNPNYSASYLNSSAPATYTGIKSTYALNDKWTLTAGVFKDTDHKIDVTPGVHLAGMLAYVSVPFNISLSLINGQEVPGRLNTIDLLADYKVTESNAIGLELYQSGFSNVVSSKLYRAVNLYLCTTLRSTPLFVLEMSILLMTMACFLER